MPVKLLLIDDEKDFAFFIRLNLQLLGDYDITVATSPFEGLKLASKIKPDLILLDIMMPGMSGLDLLKRLKENPVTLSIPVMMLTAKLDEASKREAGGLYNDDYIEKPVESNDLKSRIDEVLSRRGKSVGAPGSPGGAGRFGKWGMLVGAFLIAVVSFSAGWLVNEVGDLFLAMDAALDDQGPVYPTGVTPAGFQQGFSSKGSGQPASMVKTPTASDVSPVLSKLASVSSIGSARMDSKSAPWLVYMPMFVSVAAEQMAALMETLGSADTATAQEFSRSYTEEEIKLMVFGDTPAQLRDKLGAWDFSIQPGVIVGSAQMNLGGQGLKLISRISLELQEGQPRMIFRGAQINGVPVPSKLTKKVEQQVNQRISQKDFRFRFSELELRKGSIWVSGEITRL